MGCWLIVTLLLAAQQQAVSQIPQPRLHALYPCGAKAGGTVEVRIAGADLDGAERLIFSHSGIAAKPVDAELSLRGIDGVFAVAVAPDVPPGIYEVRAVGHLGVSNARRFAVGDRDESLEKEPNNEPSQAFEAAVGSTINGTCDAQNFDCFSVSVKKGARLTFACEALTLDSRAQVAMTLFDPSGREAGRAVATRARDPVIDFTAEVDGAHVLRLHDLTYRGGEEFGYRLTVSAGPWIDFADPPVLKAGAENKVTLHGRNLPAGGVVIRAPADPAALAPPTEMLLRPADASGDFISYRLPGSNAIRLLVAEGPIVAEAASEEEQAVALPVWIAGRFDRDGDRDTYSFEAKKGAKLWIEVFSQRLGLPTDPSISVSPSAGKDSQDMDDQPSPMPAMANNMEKRYRMGPEDPALLWTAPADGKFRVTVRDLYAQGAPGLQYVLVIRPAAPDFRLVSFALDPFPVQNKIGPGTSVLRRGGAERIHVVAFRREGYAGPIRLEAEALPPGVTARAVILGGAETSTEFVFQAAADAPAFAGPVRVIGRAEIDGRMIARPARSAEVVWPMADPQKDPLATRLTEGPIVAVDDRFVAPFSTRVGGASSLRVARGGKLKIPVTLVKNADFKEIDKAKVKLTAARLPNTKDLKPFVAKELTLDVQKPEGVLEIEVGEKAPLGAFSFFVSADVDMPFLRGPDRVKRLEEEKKRLDKLALAMAGEKEKLKAVEDLKKRVADETKKAADAAKEKKVKLWIGSSAVTVEVVAHPVALKIEPESATVRAGEKAEFTVRVEREADFSGEVKLELVAPSGAKLSLAEPVTIGADQKEARLVLVADKVVKPGSHAATLRASLKYNDKAVTLDLPLSVKVEPPSGP